MTKSRKLVSLELALKQIIKDLNVEIIKDATKKTDKWFYRCSDEDLPEDNILHIHSIELDKKSLEMGKGSPMLLAHQTMLEKKMQELKPSEKISNTLIDMGARIGKLMEITKDATDITSEKGTEISDEEKQNIAKAIKNVEEMIAKLKIAIDKDGKN